MRKNSIKNIIKGALLSTVILGSTLISIPNQASADTKVFKGNVSVSEFTTYNGRNAAVINLNLSGLAIDDVELENEPDYLEEHYSNGKVIIYGLREGVTYNNLSLEVDLDDRHGDTDYTYKINSFSFKNSGSNSQSSNSSTTKPSTGSTSSANKDAISTYLKTVYKNVFGREIDKQGSEYWTSRLAGHYTDLEDFFKNLLSEQEFLSTAPTVEDKIKKLYHGIFQREPDTQGFNFWVNEYKEELRDGDSEREALRDIIDEMTDGLEFKSILQKLGLRG